MRDDDRPRRKRGQPPFDPTPEQRLMFRFWSPTGVAIPTSFAEQHSLVIQWCNRLCRKRLR